MLYVIGYLDIPNFKYIEFFNIMKLIKYGFIYRKYKKKLLNIPIF
jgi:hypothetical protein